MTTRGPRFDAVDSKLHQPSFSAYANLNSRPSLSIPASPPPMTLPVLRNEPDGSITPRNAKAKQLPAASILPTRAHPDGEICRRFLRKECPWGARCDYVHVAPAPSLKSRSLTPRNPHQNSTPLNSRPQNSSVPDFQSNKSSVLADAEYVVKMPQKPRVQAQMPSNRFDSQASCFRDSLDKPVVRLRPSIGPPENPSQSNSPSMYDCENLNSWGGEMVETSWTEKSGEKCSDLSDDEKMHSWDFPRVENWGNTSFSSDDSHTETSSSPETDTISSMSSSTLSQSRTETRASQPPSRASCINWVRNGYCAYGEKCKYLHQTLRREYSNPSVVAVPRPRPSTTETSSPGKSSPQLRILHPPPPNKEICRNWQRRFCSRGYNCYYVHGDLKYDLPTQIRHPPPPHAGTCRQWLQDACSLGYNCHYVHGDLIYELPELEVSTPRAHHSPALPPEPPITIVIHEHTKVKIGPGFEIHELTTSVETPWVVLSHVPSRASTTLIERLLKPFGSALDIQLPPIRPKDVMTVKVRFDSSRGATAATALDGSTFLNTRISARVPVNSRSGLATIQDCSLRIEFEAPQRVAYGGYPSHERAQEAIAVAAKGQSGDYFVYATVHVGLPSIGNVTVKFTNLPPTANEDFMRRFATPEDVMWERPNYVDLKAAIAGITRILRNLGNFLELDVLPPPYSNGRIRVWASFSSATAAKSAAAALHGRKPLFVGKTRIFARHVLSLTYRVSFDDYYRDARLIEGLRESAYRKGALMSITIRRLQETMLVRLSAQGVKPLGWLKAEYEKISRGEILHRDGVPVWDFFFGRSDGQTYLRSLEAQEGVHVVADKIRRNMKLFGTPSNRAKVRTILLLKMTDLKTRQVRTIRVPGRVLGALIVTQLSHLYQKFGNGSISVNLTESTLMLLGGDELYEAAVDAVREAQQSPLAERPYVRNLAACPICFNEVVSPIYLACGHRWCRTCLNQYLLAVVDNRHFPLKCLGDEAKCTQIITLSTARTVLQPDEFNSIVEASVSSYVHAHAKEFHYCPSPDCMQIYRTGSKGTVVQCPSCLLRICSHCHAEAHDDLACAEQDGDKLFKEWAASHDVKNCPGCAIPIERDEGCHHVTCIQCQTHICWVCLQTFPKGEGIYRHMREEHGGIGLNDNE